MNYSEKLSYYLNNKKFNFKLEEYTHKLESKSKICGDSNIIYLNINSENVIENISYEYSSCSLNIMSLEILCEFLLNKNVLKIKEIDVNFFEKQFDFPLRKTHCIDLIINTLKQIREDYK